MTLKVPPWAVKREKMGPARLELMLATRKLISWHNDVIVLICER